MLHNRHAERDGCILAFKSRIQIGPIVRIIKEVDVAIREPVRMIDHAENVEEQVEIGFKNDDDPGAFESARD
jgi:hypothetical protein